MSSRKPVIHGRDHLPGGADPIPLLASSEDPRWFYVEDGTGAAFTSVNGDYAFSPTTTYTNDDGTYFTFGSIPAAGTNGLTINVAGVYEAHLLAHYVGDAAMTQSGVEASILDLGYFWNGSIGETQIRNDELQKGFWQSATSGANRPRWHPSEFLLLLQVDPSDLAGGDAWLNMSWGRTVAPDGTATGTPSMYVRRLGASI